MARASLLAPDRRCRISALGACALDLPATGTVPPAVQTAAEAADGLRMVADALADGGPAGLALGEAAAEAAATLAQACRAAAAGAWEPERLDLARAAPVWPRAVRPTPALCLRLIAALSDLDARVGLAVADGGRAGWPGAPAARVELATARGAVAASRWLISAQRPPAYEVRRGLWEGALRHYLGALGALGLPGEGTVTLQRGRWTWPAAVLIGAWGAMGLAFGGVPAAVWVLHATVGRWEFWGALGVLWSMGHRRGRRRAGGAVWHRDQAGV